MLDEGVLSVFAELIEEIGHDWNYDDIVEGDDDDCNKVYGVHDQMHLFEVFGLDSRTLGLGIKIY